MAEIRRTVLFGKLNSIGYKSLESATVFCKMRGNPSSWCIGSSSLCSAGSICTASSAISGWTHSRLAKDRRRQPAPAGASSCPISPPLDDHGSALLAADVRRVQIRTGHLVLARVESGLPHSPWDFGGVPEGQREVLADSFAQVTAGSAEGARRARRPVVTAGAAPGRPAALWLRQIGADTGPHIDLTEKARKGDAGSSSAATRIRQISTSCAPAANNRS